MQLPFYARLEHGFALHTDRWAVIAFYRQPSCVRATFNLLDFIDAPAVFGCPQTVTGFAIFDEPLPEPPVQVNLTELGAVPLWFVGWLELQAAMADDVVTIGELAAMTSLLEGSATNFREVLHPDRKLTQIASGTLADGRSFHVEVSAIAGHADDMLKHVRIEFR